jgi:hypothetical protein
MDSGIERKGAGKAASYIRPHRNVAPCQRSAVPKIDTPRKGRLGGYWPGANLSWNNASWCDGKLRPSHVPRHCAAPWRACWWCKGPPSHSSRRFLVLVVPAVDALRLCLLTRSMSSHHSKRTLEILTVRTLTPCSLVEVYRCFGT